MNLDRAVEETAMALLAAYPETTHHDEAARIAVEAAAPILACSLPHIHDYGHCDWRDRAERAEATADALSDAFHQEQEERKQAEAEVVRLTKRCEDLFEEAKSLRIELDWKNR